MEPHFYGGIEPRLQVPERQRHWLLPSTIERCARRSTRRRSTSRSAAGARTATSPTTRRAATRSTTPTLEELAALDDPRPGEQPRHDPRARAAHLRRGLPVRAADVGDARACASACRRGRCASSATPGAWKQTALRVALFSEPDAGVPDDAAAAAPRRARHRHARDRPPPDRGAPGVGALCEPGVAATASRLRRLVGVGGIGTGLFFALEGDHDLGRNESRPARLARRARLLQAPHRRPLPGGAARRARGRVARSTSCPSARSARDEAGRRLRAEMARGGHGRALRASRRRAGPTLLSVCFQYPDGSGRQHHDERLGGAACWPADVDPVARCSTSARSPLAVPEVPLGARRTCCGRASERGALRVAALTTAEIARRESRGLPRRVDLLALNEDEAAALAWRALRRRGRPSPSSRRCARRSTARGRSSARRHRRRAGAFGFDGGRWDARARLPVAVASTAGAGDAAPRRRSCRPPRRALPSPGSPSRALARAAARERPRARRPRRGLQGDVAAHHPPRTLARRASLPSRATRPRVRRRALRRRRSRAAR